MRVSWLVSLVLAVCPGVSGTVGATTLSVAQMPGHGHTAATHSGDNSGGPYFDGSGNAPIATASTNNTGGSGSHTHGLTATSKAASNLGPYYALAYIMRIS